MSITWRQDIDAALAEAKTNQRHIFVDFNAAPL